MPRRGCAGTDDWLHLATASRLPCLCAYVVLWLAGLQDNVTPHPHRVLQVEHASTPCNSAQQPATCSLGLSLSSISSNSISSSISSRGPLSSRLVLFHMRIPEATPAAYRTPLYPFGFSDRIITLTQFTSIATVNSLQSDCHPDETRKGG